MHTCLCVNLFNTTTEKAVGVLAKLTNVGDSHALRGQGSLVTMLMMDCAPLSLRKRASRTAVGMPVPAYCAVIAASTSR